MGKKNIIEEIISPWASVLVLSLKKDGSTDYRILKRLTVVVCYPLPKIQENLDKLGGSKIYSMFDAA